MEGNHTGSTARRGSDNAELDCSECDCVRAYVVVPMFPEGDTGSAQVQEVLYWQVGLCGFALRFGSLIFCGVACQRPATFTTLQGAL